MLGLYISECYIDILYISFLTHVSFVFTSLSIYLNLRSCGVIFSLFINDIICPLVVHISLGLFVLGWTRYTLNILYRG